MAIYNFNEQKPKTKKADYQKMVGCILVSASIICLFCLITHLVPFIKSFLLGVGGLFCYPFFITLMAVGFALVGHKRYVMPKKYGIFKSSLKTPDEVIYEISRNKDKQNQMFYDLLREYQNGGKKRK